MTYDEAEGIVWDFMAAVTDADNFPTKRSYQQDKQEFRLRMIAALQFAPATIFAAQDGSGAVSTLGEPNG